MIMNILMYPVRAILFLTLPILGPIALFIDRMVNNPVNDCDIQYLKTNAPSPLLWMGLSASGDI